MEKSPAFQFYGQDFLMGTLDFTAEQVGGYIRLLIHQWDKGGLPDDDAKLIQLSGVRKKYLAAIKGKFDLCEDGLLKNHRLEKVRQSQIEFREKQSRKGKESAKKRWGENNQKVTTVTNRLQTGDNRNVTLQSSSPSLSPNTNVIKKTRVGNSEFEGITSEVLWERHSVAVEGFLMNKYRTLGKEDIFKKLDEEYPPGFPFTTDGHLLNAFKSVADNLLNPKSSFKPQQNARKSGPGQQQGIGDYDRYRKTPHTGADARE